QYSHKQYNKLIYFSNLSCLLKIISKKVFQKFVKYCNIKKNYNFEGVTRMDKGDYLNIAHENLIETLRYRANTVKNGKIYETDDFLLFSIGTETSDGHLNGCVPINHKAYIETFNEAESFFG